MVLPAELAAFLDNLPDGIKTDPVVFAKLIKQLDEQATTVDAASYMREPGAGGFGGSPYAAALDHHTKLARDHVVTGVLDVSKLLRYFGEGLHSFQANATGADVDTQVGLARINAGVNVVSSSLQDTTGTTGRNSLPPSTTPDTSPDTSTDTSGDGNG